jgi:phenylacetate-CoA ligase
MRSSACDTLTRLCARHVLCWSAFPLVSALPDGKHGELVFTTLTKEAMPVIRYRTRDLTRLMSGRVRSFRRMEKVSGRSDDMIIVRGINVFPTQIEELVLRCEELAPHYLIELRTEERRDVFRAHRCGRSAPCALT